MSFQDTRGRVYKNAAEWMTEVEKIARARFGPPLRRARNTWSDERTAELSTSGRRETAVDGSAARASGDDAHANPSHPGETRPASDSVTTPRHDPAGSTST